MRRVFGMGITPMCARARRRCPEAAPARLPPPSTTGPWKPQDLHSRTIGLYRGQEIPILAGGKLYGRQLGFNVGALDLRTRRTSVNGGELASQNLRMSAAGGRPAATATPRSG